LIRDDSEDGESRDSFSDSYSDESESDKLSRCASDEGLEHDALLHPNDRLGYLYLQYFERSAPYARVPLMDKVTQCSFRRSASLITRISHLVDSSLAIGEKVCM